MHTSRGAPPNGAASDELLSSAAASASSTPSTSSAVNTTSVPASMPYSLPHMVPGVGTQSQVPAQHSIESLKGTHLRQERLAGHKKLKGLPTEAGHLRMGVLKASVLGKRHRRHPAHTNLRYDSSARSRLHPLHASRTSYGTNIADGTASAPLSPQLRPAPESESQSRTQCAYGLTSLHGFGSGRFAGSAEDDSRQPTCMYSKHGGAETETQQQHDLRLPTEPSSEDRLSLALSQQVSTLHARVQHEHHSTLRRNAFHLQPVPPARKRRKVSKGTSDIEHCFHAGALSHRPEHRLIRANIAPVGTPEPVMTPPVDPPLRQMGITGAASQIEMVAQDINLSPSTERPAAFDPDSALAQGSAGHLLSTCNSMASVRPATQHGWTGTRPSATEEADESPSHVPHAQNHVRLHTEPLQASSGSSEIRKQHRLQNRRATSLPSLNRWPTLDLSNPARHSFYIPECVARNYYSAAPRVIVTPPQPEQQRRNAASKRFEVDWPLPLQSGIELNAAGNTVLQQAAGRQLDQSYKQDGCTSYTASGLQRSAFDSSTADHCSDQSFPNHRVSLTRHQATSLQHAASSNVTQPGLHPPITRQTLHELDSSEMLRNPQLRHDVVFDSHVQFRPNFDGERGRKVREIADQYWMAVAREVSTGCTCLRFENGISQPCSCHPRMLHEPLRQERLSAAGNRTFLSFPSRIPILIHELRAILLSILPPITAGFSHPSYPILRNIVVASRSPVGNQDSTGAGPATLAAGIGLNTSSAISATTTAHVQRMISQHTLALQMLDPAHISQEVKHGVVDLQALIKFVANILKLHCAPVRDHQVDRMLHKVCEEGDIVQGLRMCFEILELMKLDIANHQLRSARPWLVETAVDFETRWFREQLEQSKFTLERTSTWFNAARLRIRERLTPKLNVDTAMSRKEFISRAYNEGFLHILFEAPTDAAISFPDEAGKSSNVSGLPPSSSSINFTYTSCYPETFQFDAYRLITFHNDITDLTVAFMFLMLFRQLACSPLDDTEDNASGSTGAQLSAAAIRTQALLLAGNQTDSVKNSIWCLVNEANAQVGAQSKTGGFLPRGVASAANADVRDSKSHSPLVFGVNKFDSPVWRASIKDVLLQVAAQARAVQLAAREAVATASSSRKKEAEEEFEIRSGAAKAIAASSNKSLPSAKTLAMLSSWMDHNLKAEALLFKLCRSRLREVILAILVDRLSGSPPASTATAASAAAAAVKRKAHAKKTTLRIATGGSASKLGCSLSGHDDDVAHSEADGETPAKRMKLLSSVKDSTHLSPIRISSSTSASPTADVGSGVDTSRQSLAQQQAISLRRLLSAQQAARSAGVSEDGVHEGATSSSPSSPISIPTTPVPRSPLWTTSTLEERDWPSALTRSGLEPFAAEVRLLGDRISTLAAFHLRVFRNLYERLDLADRQSA